MFEIAVPVFIDDISEVFHDASFMVSFRYSDQYEFQIKYERSYYLIAKIDRTFVFVKSFFRLFFRT